jgi:D-3-phosphoglycerate dehydrogenase
MSKNILIVDDLHPIFIEQVQTLGYTCNYQPLIKLDEVLAIIAGYEGLMVRSKFQVDRTFLNAAINLKFIARAGAGMDNIDEAYAAEKGITLVNAPEGNRDAVGEHAVGMLLSLMNNLNRADAEVRAGLWQRGHHWLRKYGPKFCPQIKGL